MPIKTFRPITPTLRFQTKLVNDDITTNEPHKPLLSTKKRTGGRNNTGMLSVRHIGGGHKKKIRAIDFKRDYFDYQPYDITDLPVRLGWVSAP